MTRDGVSPLLPRAALVTGGGRRIGRAIALDLARQGFAVAVHCHHSAADAQAVRDEITGHGGRAVVVSADLGREDQVTSLVASAQSALGPLGLLVNNASVFEKDDALGADRASWDLHMEVNLRAPFVLTQGFARALPPDAEGLVVNLLDQRVWSLTPHFTSYTLSKAALWAATQTLALALAPRIRVVGIGPGPALPSSRQTEAQFAAQVADLPLARGTSPEEVCRTLRFLLATPSITGQMIALDGGQHLGWAVGGTTPDE
ncbi:SDR family oxidoreductase [Paramagnetospirillum magneticum]|uniref:Dehydrogenase with different specificities n=1 Tax=Paramagnetospirillum magneticum (strain ATCC 700264 / AMB-1) TaxID=342108 RepID=Q2W0M0_PARM1|nr:SDR family oxidoreductase [Paramagnetospirillum magneticum]BAE52605.1 Dehydrogenase with different specificities [Paramagnetospirillum magneticum AMB-1]